MSAIVPAAHERRARHWLTLLQRDVGAAGLAAAASLPGLAAAIDQHAAAVRDATTIGLEATAAVAGLALLANYAQGVLTHARAHGWTPPAAGSWPTADWVSLRLTAVCELASRHGHNPSTDGPARP